MENIRVVSDPRAGAGDVDFLREGLSLFNVAATGDSYYSPLAIFLRDDRERDLGRYDDPNIWMRHPIR